MIRQWAENLVFVKTFPGLKSQLAVFKHSATEKGAGGRMAAPMKESKGIDGYSGNTACSVKLYSDLAQSDLAEHLEAKVIDCKRSTIALNS